MRFCVISSEPSIPYVQQAAAVFQPFYSELRIYSSSCAAALGHTGKSPPSGLLVLSGTSPTKKEQVHLQVCVRVCSACRVPWM